VPEVREVSTGEPENLVLYDEVLCNKTEDVAVQKK